MPIAVVGGSGFQSWEQFRQVDIMEIETPYSRDTVKLMRGHLEGREILFLPRHGPGHTVPPHRINYRANIWALNQAGVSAILGIATVGGISADASPGSLLIPDEIIDYTYDRAHTFFDGEDGKVAHVDMTEPYCEALRGRLLEAASRRGIAVTGKGTYAATQGPRFETPAEIRRLERDGADVVGMTGMPEAALARELRLAYAAVTVIVNPAAGKTQAGISMDDVRETLAAARSRVASLLAETVVSIEDEKFDVPPPVVP